MTSRDDPNWGWEFVVEDFVYARLCDDDWTEPAVNSYEMHPDQTALFQ